MTNNAHYTKYFVTGGAGFIGSHMVDRLISEGKQVTVYDNLSSGKMKNLSHVSNNKKLTTVIADLLDSDSLTRAMKGHDVVVHLGANTDIVAGNKIIDLDLKSGTIGTLNVLEAMRNNNIENIIFSSSACVYGDGAVYDPNISLSETFGPLLPINLYGASKLGCEGLISSYCHLFGVKAWVFRFANVVGARMGHGVIYDFIHKLRKNPRELEILGDGKQEKPFFMVGDCIDGMLFAFRNADVQCEIYNLGNESVATVTNIAKIVTKEMGLNQVILKYAGGKRGWPGDTPTVHFSTKKMNNLGWQAKHNSEEAIQMAARLLLEE